MIDYGKVIRGLLNSREIIRKKIADYQGELEHTVIMALYCDTDNAECHKEIAKCLAALIEAEKKHLAILESETAEWYYKLSDTVKISA